MIITEKSSRRTGPFHCPHQKTASLTYLSQTAFDGRSFFFYEGELITDQKKK